MSAVANDPLMYAFGRADDRFVPLSAVAEITHACNVDCEHCYLDLVPDTKIGALSTDEWKRIFRELRASGCLFLTLTGGEVLVRKDWFELAMYARELGFAVKMFTNGTLIDDRNADRILEVRPLSVEISLLGGIPATHNAIAQRRNAFDKTIDGVRRLKARGIPVLLKCVLMEKNVGEMAEMRTLAESLGCNMYFDLEVTPKNDGSLGPKALVASDEAMVEAARDLAQRAATTFGEKDLPREERLAETPCGAGRRTCQIGPTGDLFPCTQFTKPVGNLRKTSFSELWSGSAELEKIRATRISSFTVCSGCALLDICSPCMALSLLETGEISGPSMTKCNTAEIRARARGRSERSAWFLQLEEARAKTAASTEAEDRPRVRLPLVG